MFELNQDSGAEKRQIYIDYMKASNQQLRNKGITQDLNEISLRQWRSQTWSERIQYLQELQMQKKKKTIRSFLKPTHSNQQRKQIHEDGLKLLFQQELQDHQSLNNHNTNEEKSLQNWIIQKQNELLLANEPQLNNSQEIKTTQKGKNEEYIQFYKYQFQEIKAKNHKFSNLEITKIIKDKWKELKKIKKLYQNEKSSSPKQLNNQNIEDSKNREVQEEKKPELTIDLAQFTFKLDSQIFFQIPGSQFIEAFKSQQSQDILIQVKNLLHGGFASNYQETDKTGDYYESEQKSIINNSSDSEDYFKQVNKKQKFIHSDHRVEINSPIIIEDRSNSESESINNTEQEQNKEPKYNFINPLKSLLSQKIAKRND